MENKYLLSKNNDKDFKYSIPFYDYYLNHNYDSTHIKVISKNKKSIIVIGDFIDGNHPMKSLKEITNNLFHTQNIEELLENIKYYAGRYLIMIGDESGFQYIVTDPISTIPVNYVFNDEEYLVSSHAKYIADKCGYHHSDKARKINQASEQQQPLPYNITLYEEIKTLIPNHILNLNDEKMVRFYPVTDTVKKITMDNAVIETIRVSKNILKGYLNTRKLSLPLTSGIDSRLILSLMKGQTEELKMYTYLLDNFTSETDDIKISSEIADAMDIEYYVLPLKNIPNKLEQQIYNELNGEENDDILKNGYTYSKSKLKNYYSVPGDIISISKSPFGKNLPESFANLNYFLTKTHNYSSEIEEYIQSWIDNTKEYSQNSGISLFDLYNWEYRLGRWIPKSIKNYDYFIDQVYIFNCRYLIELWVSISKSERTNRSLHKEIIQKEWPELLEFPVNPDDKLKDKLFSNSYLFYIGSFIKYFLGGRLYNEVSHLK